MNYMHALTQSNWKQVTRTFDEEAGRHRKFALGGHELMFNPFQDWFGHGILTPIFKTFLTCDIPSYYKIFLTSYLLSYTSGGIYIIVFTVAAIVRLIGTEESGLTSLYAFSPASILILNIVVYYVIGYTCFIIATCRMHWNNKDLFFPQYRNRGIIYLIWKELRYCMTFQIMFYTVMGNYFFLGGVDHLMSRTRICGATNKDPLKVSCFTALADICAFNSGSWTIALLLAILAMATLWRALEFTDDLTVLEDAFSDPFSPTTVPASSELTSPTTLQPIFGALLFTAPTVLMSICAVCIPIIMNPYVWGCYKRSKPKPNKKESKMDITSVVGSIDTKLYSPKGVSKKRMQENKNVPQQQKKVSTKASGKTGDHKNDGRSRLQSV